VSVPTQMLSVFTHVACEYVTIPTIMVNTVHLTFNNNNNNNNTVGTRYNIVMFTYPFITRFSTFYLCFQAEAVAGAAV